MNVPKTGRGATLEHAQMICQSYQKWTGQPLISIAEGQDLVEQLFYAPRVILSHGVEEDPILNYGNAMALRLWEMDWDSFTRMPSRFTAEPVERKVREQFMKRVNEQGYVDHYTGIRISSTGRRFYIVDAVVWNLVNEQGKYCGQAATFNKYRYVDES